MLAYSLIGAVIGCIVTILYFNFSYPTVGNWHINESDPEKDVFQVEFTKPPEILFHKKWAVFAIYHEKNTSHNGE